MAAQEALFPADQALEFRADEAKVASELYREIIGPRGRETDIAIAAHAIARQASLWTFNAKDFDDMPRLILTET